MLHIDLNGIAFFDFVTSGKIASASSALNFQVRNRDEITSPFSEEECKPQFASPVMQAEACTANGEVFSWF